MTSPSALEFRRILVEDSQKLGEVVQTLMGAGTIGLDVEMGQRIERLPGGLTRGRQILALIQMTGEDLSAVVDPLGVRDLSPLAPLMSGPDLKVVLGGATDVQLLSEHGLEVRNVVDLAEMAISVFGHREEGMRALADRALGIRVDKTIRRQNWLRRPINSAMLSYAHRDAELTLLLFQWFQTHHPDLVSAHVRPQLHPAPPSEVPEWIRLYLTKRLDPLRLLREQGIDPATSSDRLLEDVRMALAQDLSPAQQRRMIRLIGDLRLGDLYGEVSPYADSPSSVFRSAAARTLGRLGNATARPTLLRLTSDPIPDVVKAAETGLRDLTAGPPKPLVPAGPESETGLKPEAMATLEKMRISLSSEDPSKTETSKGLAVRSTDPG